VGVVVFKGESALLIRRAQEPRQGEWSIPGGAVELGETLREAAAREFAEECGGRIEPGDVVDAVDIVVRDEAGQVKYHYVVIDFWAEWQGGELLPSGELVETRWVRVEDLESLGMSAVTRRVIEKAQDARAGHAAGGATGR
jgi:ADP-ribose pyrophosphatase YjhB (NUDIX family)